MQRSAIDRTGQVVAGQYQITGSLSVGTLATVYAAASVTTGVPFAIKILHDEVLERGSLHERFQREHVICARLQSSQCLQILEFGTLESGVPFQVMEYVPGESLAEILDREERLPMNRALVLFSRVLEALVACGDAGIIHRDIKPENLLIVRDQQGVERVKLIGFGIAKLIGQAAEGHDRLTSVGLVLGTPHYIAPEWVSSDNVDSRSDLYSATVMLFEMLTSAPPFLHEDKREIMKMHLQSPPPRLADRVPGETFVEELEELIQIGLAKDPAGRFPDAREYLNRVAGLNARAGITGGAAAIPAVSSPVVPSPDVLTNAAVARPAVVQPIQPGAYVQGQSPVVATAPPRASTTEVPHLNSRTGTSKMWMFGGGVVAILLALLAVVFGRSSSDEDTTSAGAGSALDATAVTVDAAAPVTPDNVGVAPIKTVPVSAHPVTDNEIAKVTRLWTKGRLKVTGFVVGPQDSIANGACRYGQADSIDILLCSESLDPVSSPKKMKRPAAGTSPVRWRARIKRAGLHLRVEDVRGKSSKKRRRKIENIFRKMTK